MDGWTEQIWKEALLIMEQDYTTSDPVSPDDLAGGRIVPNPNDDGEHPFTDAPQKNEYDGTASKYVPIRSVELSVANGNGGQCPWGHIPQLFYMLPYFSRSGYHEWLDFNILILINDIYLVVYHIHSSYDNRNIVKGGDQDDYRKRVSDAIVGYLFDKDYGRMRIGSSLGLYVDEEDLAEDGPVKSNLMNAKGFKHEFSP